MNDTHTETNAPETTTPAPNREGVAAASASFVDALIDVGAAWAAYGLKVGKLALDTSAATLGKVARALESLAEELEKRKPAAPNAEAPSA